MMGRVGAGKRHHVEEKDYLVKDEYLLSEGIRGRAASSSSRGLWEHRAFKK